MPNTEKIIIELLRIEESLDTLARHVDEEDRTVTDGEQKAIEKQINQTADSLRKLLHHYNMYGQL